MHRKHKYLKCYGYKKFLSIHDLVSFSFYIKTQTMYAKFFNPNKIAYKRPISVVD